MAKLEKPELSPEGIVYTRRVNQTKRDVIDAAIKAALNPELKPAESGWAPEHGSIDNGFDPVDEAEHAVNLWVLEVDTALDNLQETIERMPETADDHCELLWQLLKRAETIESEIRSQWSVHYRSREREALRAELREELAQEAEGKR